MGAVMSDAEIEIDRRSAFFEFWPWYVIYIPLIIEWLALGLRFGSLSLPTGANPGIEAGGLCGESKDALFARMGPIARAAVAEYCAFAVVGDPVHDFDIAERGMAERGLVLPVVAKPDVGCRGIGVRLIESRTALIDYVTAFPAGERMILQRYTDLPGEAGIYYLRRPGEAHGRIWSLTFKYLPEVTGDGRTSLRELILNDCRARRSPHLYLRQHAARLDWIPGHGERVRLVFTGNHARGAVFRNGKASITPKLTAAVERIASDLPGLQFGRFDVKFASREALERGEGFTVLEVNGAGSEAIQAWDADATLFQAYRALTAQIRLIFELGAANRRAGHQPISTWRMIQAFRREKQLMRRYPNP